MAYVIGNDCIACGTCIDYVRATFISFFFLNSKVYDSSD